MNEMCESELFGGCWSTSYSRHSFGWIVPKECVDMQWEKFHSSPIDRGWRGELIHCTTVADLNHARHHTAARNCILLQDHRQQRILIAPSHSILMLQDFFSLPPALNISARYLDGRYGFVVQNWPTHSQTGNLLDELSSWTEGSFFPC